MPAEPTYREVVAKEEDPLLRMMPGYDRSRIVSRFYNACMLDALEKTVAWMKEKRSGLS